MLLAGDVGATKTSLAVFAAGTGAREPLAEATFVSAQFSDLAALLRTFLEQANLPVNSISLGVAGPVVGGQATITNLGWVVEAQRLQEALSVSAVLLLNDLQAIGYEVPSLRADDVHILNQGQPLRGGSVAIVAPGTGLGEAFLTWNGSRYEAHPSEGGHVDFAPTDELQAGLLSYMLERNDHVSYEWVCSGMGLPHVYAYLKASGLSEPLWLTEQLAQASDPTPAIVDAALSPTKSCELCTVTLDTFAAILGAEAGNLALKVLATAGVYIGGGIPPRILPVLENGRFMQAFLAKGRFRDFMSRVPVKVIVNPKVALYGAARAGLES